MSLASQISSDVSAVFLNTDDFAGTVTRYPLGDTGSGAETTGVFCEDEKSDQSRDGGRDNVRMGTLYVAASVTTDPQDRWLIDGEAWDVVSVGQEGSAMKTVRVTRVDEETRTGPLRVI